MVLCTVVISSKILKFPRSMVHIIDVQGTCNFTFENACIIIIIIIIIII